MILHAKTSTKIYTQKRNTCKTLPVVFSGDTTRFVTVSVRFIKSCWGSLFKMDLHPSLSLCDNMCKVGSVNNKTFFSFSCSFFTTDRKFRDPAWFRASEQAICSCVLLITKWKHELWRTMWREFQILLKVLH